MRTAAGRVVFARYAEAFGATGMRIDGPDQIGPILPKAFDTPGPVVVYIPIDDTDNPKLFETVRTASVH
jgi:acetolactate synthase I/II/III large subunit